MNKDSIKNAFDIPEKIWISPNFRGGGGICTSPNFKVKKSVYTDKISMNGGSV